MGNAERMKRVIATSGGDVLFGSVEACVIEEKFIPFTIISNPDLNSEVMTDEIFGPVLPVVGVDSLDAAISLVHKVDPTPLALYVYTQDKAAAEKVLTSCTSGSAAVNTCNEQMLNVECTFGGIGTSGMGAYHGKTGFLEFSHKRTILYRDPEGYLIPQALWPKSNKIGDPSLRTLRRDMGFLSRSYNVHASFVLFTFRTSRFALQIFSSAAAIRASPRIAITIDLQRA